MRQIGEPEVSDPRGNKEAILLRISVLKYGGTSVASELGRSRIVEQVQQAQGEGFSPVVVVSAIGRKGDPYATDTLINLLPDPELEHKSREMDLLMSCGEIISAVIITNLLKSNGVDATAFTGFQAGIQTDGTFGDARILSVNTEDIQSALESGKVVVVTGFQGIDAGGNITTLGRGGSDTTAAVLGVALDAEKIEIYTDVEGVMTADPRVVKDARIIDQISYEEVYQMARDGAKVVDHKAVAIAREGNKPLVIRSTFSDAPGTEIRVKTRTLADPSDPNKVLTAVALKQPFVQMSVTITARDHRNELMLNRMEQERISIDMINFFDKRKVFIIGNDDLTKVKKILDDLELEYETLPGCCKVTAIGHRMHGVPGVMKRIVFALSRENIEILQSSDSNTTISCLIRAEHASRALQILHNEFKLSE